MEAECFCLRGSAIGKIANRRVLLFLPQQARGMENLDAHFEPVLEGPVSLCEHPGVQGHSCTQAPIMLLVA